MEVLHPNCAGLDVHKKSISVCARKATGTKVERELRKFGTTTKELIELFDWLTERGCTHVVMESTGVYWKPVWRALEGGFELVLANARHVKGLPGRKSDINDAQWLADLLAHGLVRGSFVPAPRQARLRELTRTRKQMSREATRQKQRLQKALEVCNLKMASVISDITGVSGRAILKAMINGERDPIKLADLAKGKIKHNKWLALAQSLQGYVSDHDRFMFKLHLQTLEDIEKQMEIVEARIEEVMSEDFHEAARRLQTTPGIGQRVAETIVAEVGVNMDVFPSAGHLVSWAGLCPSLNESGGKRRNSPVRSGNPWLKTTLVQAAWGAVRKRDSYLRARFLRLKTRGGARKAIVAVAASMLRSAYFILKYGSEYNELGAHHFDAINRGYQTRKLVRRLQNLGYDVELSAQEAPSANAA